MKKLAISALMVMLIMLAIIGVTYAAASTPTATVSNVSSSR